MLKQFAKHIKSQFPFVEESKLLLAVSGGMDSVVLAYLCKKMELHFALAHCNFNLRGLESDSDEEFVIDLAENLDVEVFVESFDCEAYAEENKLSTQVAARELRYNWFEELCNQLGFDYVLTAHHADDNLETFLINLSRGTGLDGLMGIPMINGHIIRPLLPFSRDQILDYAKDQNFHWREDSSNLSSKYLRNRLRHDVIPKLKEINPKFLDNFLSTQEHLEESHIILEDRLDDIYESIIETISEEAIYFNVEAISNLSNPKAYMYYFFKDYGFTAWDDIVGLLKSQSGKQVFSKTHRLIKDRKTLILTNLNANESLQFLVHDIENPFQVPLGIMHFDAADSVEKSTKNSICVDKELLKLPLVIRKWQEGDYFYPFGMKGKKKLSKFFKDEKLSLPQKENVWLLCSQDKIVWVIGKRQDKRFKVTNRTKKILKISLQ